MPTDDFGRPCKCPCHKATSEALDDMRRQRDRAVIEASLFVCEREPNSLKETNSRD